MQMPSYDQKVITELPFNDKPLNYLILQCSFYTNEGYFDKDMKLNSIGKASYHQGNRYQGEWSNNNIEGYGIFHYSNGEIYEGTFSNNKRNGIGIITYPNGDKYEGEWVNDVEEGYGSYTDNKTSYIYNGLFMNNQLTSPAIITNDDRIIYQGQINNDTKEGYAILTLNNDCKYEGFFYDNHLIGYRRVIDSNGNILISRWSQGSSYSITKHHTGVISEKNEKIMKITAKDYFYQGEYVDESQEGYGIHVKKRKKVLYEGEKKNDKRNGIGIKRYSNGDVYKGEWENGKRNGYGTMIQTSGNAYKGYFSNDCFIIGKQISLENYIYEGEFVNWEKNGYGVLTMRNGEVIQGLFIPKSPNMEGNNMMNNNEQNQLSSLIGHKRKRSDNEDTS